MTAKKYHNYFSYKLSENTRVCGKFNIYQAINGSIQIVMGNGNAALTHEQVQKLNINPIELQDFDHDLYNKYYQLTQN